MKKDEAKKLKNVALLSVYSPISEVDTSNTGSSLVTIITERVQSDKLSMEPTLNKTKELIFKKKKMLFPFNLASESSVLGEKAVNDIPKSKDIINSPCAATGYPVVKVNSKEEAVSFLSKSKRYDAAMIVSVFTSLEKSGISIMGISAGRMIASTKLAIWVYDRNGEIILRHQVSGKSDNSIAQFMGWYKVREVNEISAESAEAAVQAFTDWMKTI